MKGRERNPATLEPEDKVHGPTTLASNPPDKAEALKILTEAIDHSNNGRYREALEAYNHGLDFGDFYAESVYGGKAYVCEHLGRFEEGIEARESEIHVILDTATEDTDPPYKIAGARLTQARMFAAIGRFDEMSNALAEVDKFNEKLGARAHLDVAVILATHGHPGMAIGDASLGLRVAEETKDVELLHEVTYCYKQLSSIIYNREFIRDFRYNETMDQAALLQAAAEILRGGFPADRVDRALGYLVADVEHKITSRAEAEVRSAAGKLTPQKIREAKDKARLDGLELLYQQRLEASDLPSGGFTTKEQADAGALLATTLRELQKLQGKLGLPVTKTPERVLEAQAMASAYRRHHDKETGELIPPRRRGRPRRTSIQATSSPP